MNAPTIFLSAASLDLKEWRDVLHGAFSRAGFRVFTQDQSLGAAPGDVKSLLTKHVLESDCVIHLAGMGYGSDAQDPFPEAPGFQCSWTQFEYYFAHQQKKDVIAYVCAPNLSKAKFAEKGAAAERKRKARLQQEHRQRVESGKFDGTPLAGKVKRTCNETVDSVQALLKAVAAAVGTLHKLDQDSCAKAQQQLYDLAAAVERIDAGVGTANEKLDSILALLMAKPQSAGEPALRLHQLPLRPEGFVGRESDLDALRKLDHGGGAMLTGLKGMGGIGKTALALVLAHEWLSRYPDAQLFLDGRGTQTSPPPPDAAALLARVIQTFLPAAKLPEDEAQLRGIYLNLLRDKKVLILLDNAANAAQAAPLTPPAGSALIVTSRQSFMLGTNAPHNVGRLPDDQAAALLREYHSALTSAEAAELVRLCAGLPLALRVAGAHMALDAAEREGPPDVAGYLQLLRSGRLAQFDLEAGDAGEVSISETLRLSESQLPPVERESWRRLGVFTASFDARAAQAVAEADEPMLARFVRRSLLEREGADRYKLHDLAAEYALMRLENQDPKTLPATYLAHARHYYEVAWEARNLYIEERNPVAGLALFDRERAQIEAAFATGSAGILPALPFLSNQPSRRLAEITTEARECSSVLLDLVSAVTYTADLRFHPRQRILWLEAQLTAARLLKDRQQEGAALGNLGNAHACLGDPRKAIEFYEQALVVMREIGDRRGEGNALGNLGSAHYDLGDARKAIELYEQWLAIARKVGDRRGEGAALGGLGLAHTALGDACKAIEFYEQQLAIVREISDRRGEGNALGNLGIAYAALGDARKAIEFHDQALVIDREIGDRRGEGAVLGNLGVAYKDLGDERKAIEFYEQALIIDREIGDRRGEGNALWSSALAYDSLGARAEAIERAEAALRLYEAIEDPNAAMVRRRLTEWRAKQQPA
ncbi:MAG: tetratricopeptide repeat protein [Candidatus Sumerlaeota bacterium]|nr:tetratricopeptide repeat protein [Candidatus Sumerlaeota bacterium]